MHALPHVTMPAALPFFSWQSALKASIARALLSTRNSSLRSRTTTTPPHRDLCDIGARKILSLTTLSPPIANQSRQPSQPCHVEGLLFVILLYIWSESSCLGIGHPNTQSSVEAINQWREECRLGSQNSFCPRVFTEILTVHNAAFEARRQWRV